MCGCNERIPGPLPLTETTAGVYQVGCAVPYAPFRDPSGSHGIANLIKIATAASFKTSVSYALSVVLFSLSVNTCIRSCAFVSIRGFRN